MANWCSCSFGVYGGTKKEMQEFYEYMNNKLDKKFQIDQEMNYWTEAEASDPKKYPFTDEQKKNIQNSSGNNSLVMVFNDNYTFDEFEEMSQEGMTLRASLESVDDYSDDTSLPHVNIYMESAWGPCDAFINKFLTDNFPNLGFVMIAEEPGNEIYVNTDAEGKIFTDRYKIDSYDDSEYFENFEQVKERIEEKINVDLSGDRFDSVDKIQNFLDDYNEFMSDHEMEENQLWIREYTYE